MQDYANYDIYAFRAESLAILEETAETVSGLCNWTAQDYSDTVERPFQDDFLLSEPWN